VQRMVGLPPEPTYTTGTKRQILSISRCVGRDSGGWPSQDGNPLVSRLRAAPHSEGAGIEFAP